MVVTMPVDNKSYETIPLQRKPKAKPVCVYFMDYTLFQSASVPVNARQMEVDAMTVCLK